MNNLHLGLSPFRSSMEICFKKKIKLSIKLNCAKVFSMFSNYLRHLIFQISFHYVFSVNFVGISRSWLCSFVLRLTKQQRVKLYFDRLKYKIFSIEPTEPFEPQHSRNDLLIVFKHDHLLKFLLVISHWFWTLLFRAVNKI